MVRSKNSQVVVYMMACQQRPRQPLVCLCILAAVFFAGGCIGASDKYPSLHFQRIDGQANAFRLFVTEPLGVFIPKKAVETNVVRVFEQEPGAGDMKTGRLCWEVLATTHVSAEGFKFVAGQVPRGFIQIYPPAGEIFEPVPGRTYEIAVTTSHQLAGPWAATSWVAE